MKKKMKKKIRDFDKKKTPGISGLVTTTVLNRKIGEVEKKIPYASEYFDHILISTTPMFCIKKYSFLMQKIGVVEIKILDVIV